jgi:hypothetical protein
MSDVERKDLCPCGSGLLCNRCHGSVLQSPKDIPHGSGGVELPEMFCYELLVI